MLGAWVFFTQRAQIYYPALAVAHPGAQVLWIASQGERLKVWVVVPGVGHNTLDLASVSVTG
jgi:hypothetical protein